MKHKHNYYHIRGNVDADGNFYIVSFCDCGAYKVLEGWNDEMKFKYS